MGPILATTVACACAAFSHPGGVEPPAAFLRNDGQWSPPARFAARIGAVTARFEAGAIALRLGRADGGGEVVRLVFEDACPDARIEGEGKSAARHGFFVGADRERWRSDVPAFASLWYRGLYPGVDLRVRDGGGLFEYDLFLEPGACLDAVTIRCEGGRELGLDGEGTLLVHTAEGVLAQRAPHSWQVGPGGEERPVDCRFRLLGGGRFGFDVEELEPDLGLTIDPGLAWSTFLGGSAGDEIHAVAVDPVLLQVVVVGATDSLDFPTTPGAIDPDAGTHRSAFVTRMSGFGTALVSSTYLGGAGETVATGVAIDAYGRSIVCGRTNAADFPTTVGAYDPTCGGNGEAFLARVSADGQTLHYSTFLGGGQDDRAEAVTWQGQHGATVVGSTLSDDFPTTSGAFDRTRSGKDAFVAHVNMSNMGPVDLLYSTFLGGSGAEEALDVAVYDADEVVVGGWTGSADFPLRASPPDDVPGGSSEGFLSHVRMASGANLQFSTYVGGSGDDRATAVGVTNFTKDYVVAGDTDSSDFPTTEGAYDRTRNGTDGFVARVATGGYAFEYSSFLGGNGSERVDDLWLGPTQYPVLLGTTASPDFPVTPGVHDESHGGPWDGFVTELSAEGDALRFSTFVGGSALESSLYAGRRGDSLVLAGTTASSDYPIVAGALQETYGGGASDGFVSLLPVFLQLDSYTPNHGSENGGTWVELVGGGFVPGETEVFFGDEPVVSIEVLDSSYVLLQTPPHEPGLVDMTVSTPYRTHTYSSVYVYEDAPPPPPPGGGGGKEEFEQGP